MIEPSIFIIDMFLEFDAGGEGARKDLFASPAVRLIQAGWRQYYIYAHHALSEYRLKSSIVRAISWLH
jgi:hypothetical protein